MGHRIALYLFVYARLGTTDDLTGSFSCVNQATYCCMVCIYTGAICRSSNTHIQGLWSTSSPIRDQDYPSGLDAEPVNPLYSPHLITKLVIMSFTRVLYPPQPPTSNTLSAEERAQLVRSAKKLSKVLGTTPQLIDETCPICEYPILQMI